MKRTPLRWWEYVCLGGALVWAATLRFGWPEAYPFAFDEARVSALALALAREGHWPLTGMVSSAGVANLPAAVWLYALPYAWSGDPLVATRFIAFASLGVVLGLWWLARRMWGTTPALAVAWIAAGSPYLAFYARNIWAQNWLPLLAIIWGIAVWQATQQQSRWAAAAAGALAAMAPQVHYAGVLLWGPTLVFGVLYPPLRRATGVGMALGSVVAVPSLWAVVRTLPQAASPEVWSWGRVHVHAVLQPLQLLSGYGWHQYMLGPKWPLGTHPLALVGAPLILVGWIIGMGKIVARARREPTFRPWAWILGVWMGASMMLWGLAGIPSRLHYHLPALPAWLLTIAAGVAALKRKPWQRVALLLAVGVALVQGVMLAQGLHIVATTYTPGGMSTPLGYLRSAAREIDDGRPVTVVVPGTDPTVDGDAAVWDVLLWEKPHRFVDGRYNLLIPRREGWLFFVASWLPAWEIAQKMVPRATDRATYMPRREGEFPFVRLPVSGEAPGGFWPVEPVALANGARLMGWRLQPLGQQVRLITVWRVELQARLAYHQFNHVYVPHREQPLLVHDVPTSSAAWQEGDWLITWADFPTPLPKDAWFGVGMYTYPEIQRVSRADAGNQLAPIRLVPPPGLMTLDE